MVRRILKIAAVVLFGIVMVSAYLSIPGLHAANPDTIALTPSEKAQAISIAEARQQLQFDREAAETDFQRREREIELRAQKLCFELKKSHQIDPRVNYWLDEWRGVLKKSQYETESNDPRRQLKVTHVLRKP